MTDTTDAAAHASAIRTTPPPPDAVDHAAAIVDLTDRVADRASDLAFSAHWSEEDVDEWILAPMREADAHVAALDAARIAAEQRADAAEADLKTAADRSDRYFKALIRALPGHYDHVLWTAYTLGRPAVFDKREAWRKSGKCKVARFDGEHWLRLLGLRDGDWPTVEAGDLDAEPAPARAEGGA